jgi:mono/diheme cytochrome c family protein
MRERLALTLTLAALTALLPRSAASQTQTAENSVSGAAVYEENCEMCHEVGGLGIAGEIPPLVDNSNIDDLEYLDRVIREGLSGQIEVDGEIYDDEMEGFSELSGSEVAALIDYIRGGFAAPTTVAVAQSPQLEVLGDAARGAELFAGRQRLANDGPICLACHAAGMYGHLGGSGLGPNLSGLRSRFAGEKGLSSAVRRPPSPVMRPVYAGRELTEQEVADLAAFFGVITAEETRGGTDWLLVAGGTGALALFGLMAVFAATAMRRSYSRMLRDSR